MAKKKKTSKPAVPAKPTSAARLTTRLRKLEEKLVQQLNEHATLMQKLNRTSSGEQARGGQDRRGPAVDMLDPAVQQRRLAELVASNPGPLADGSLRAVLRELVSGTRSLVAPVNVAYLGPEHSYSHVAAIEHFGSSAALVPVATIGAVFEEVHESKAAYGLVPIENSTDGRIVDTLDMFARIPVRICGEVQLRIHHQLLANCARESIREVLSKPQALSQCRNWLAKHLPGVLTLEMTSTAAAAKMAVEKSGVAAIASREAGMAYGLNVIVAEIEDSKDNVTRFVVISHESAPKTGRDKTALMFELDHRPGALADVMTVFKRHRLNLTWIESFPIRQTKNEYLFFVEFVGHAQEVKSRRALASLEKKVVRVDVLGSFAQTEPVG